MTERSPQFWAVVPAAGSGQRMLQDDPKQYLRLAGRTLIEHSLQTLLAWQGLQKIMVCVAPGDARWPTISTSKDPRVVTVEGGASRAQSVLNGLLELQASAHAEDWVLVHDAARPCFDTKQLTRLVTEVGDDPVGGILAVPAKDTLKRSDATGDRIETTIDRSRVWQAQTPQMFRYQLLKEALTSALANGSVITDEASAVELAGYSAKLVAGDAVNLKVTTPEDLRLAEYLLS